MKAGSFIWAFRLGFRVAEALIKKKQGDNCDWFSLEEIDREARYYASVVTLADQRPVTIVEGVSGQRISIL